MRLTILNERPAILDEKGRPVFHSIYTGTRYWGTMWNVLKDYTDQHWTVRETAPFFDDKDFSVLGENIRYYVAECENSILYAALGAADALLRTETRFPGPETNWETVVAVGGMWAERLDRVMYNSTTSNGGVSFLDMNARTHVRIFTENDHCESAVHMPVIDKTGRAAHFGAASFERHFSFVFVCEGGTVEYRVRPDDCRLREGQIIHSDWMALSLYEDMAGDLPRYGGLIHRFNRYPALPAKAPVGFCSWYYYMENINERMVRENLETIDGIRDRVPLKVFQIDAGWEAGDDKLTWDKERFPNGMAYCADLIRARGLTPGIWITPFNYPKDGPFAAEHPGWFVKDADGRPIDFHGNLTLDATHPEAQEYIRKLYRTVTYDWGYRYLKLDLIAHYMTAGKYHDPEAGALQNLRTYFRIAREASHPDTYILGCTCPMFETAGILDGMRISVDIFERWESLIKAFNLVLKRYYLSSLFMTDADCLMIRTKENEDADCRRYCSRNEAEIQTFLTAIYAAGGALFISDKLPLMTDAQIEKYQKLFPWRAAPGIPLDLMDSYIPGIIDMGYDGDIRTVALINWGERARAFQVTLDGAYEAVEHWSDEKLGRCDGTFKTSLEPHHSILVHFKRII